LIKTSKLGGGERQKGIKEKVGKKKGMYARNHRRGTKHPRDSMYRKGRKKESYREKLGSGQEKGGSSTDP